MRAPPDYPGFFLDSGGYGSYQDGVFHTGFSKRYVKFQIDPPLELGDGSSGRDGRDEDFATVLGNLVFAGDDHGVGTALIAHQAAPDTTPPTVMWMSPAAGTTGAALTSRIGLSFSDHIDAASLTDRDVSPTGQRRVEREEKELDHVHDSEANRTTSSMVPSARSGVAHSCALASEQGPYTVSRFRRKLVSDAMDASASELGRSLSPP